MELQRDAGVNCNTARERPVGGPRAARIARLRHLSTQVVLLLATALAVIPAGAHTVDKGLATITVSERTVLYNLLLSVTAPPQTAESSQVAAPAATTDYATLLQEVETHVHVASGGHQCPLEQRSITPPAQQGGNAAARMQFACTGDIADVTIRDDLFDVFGTGYHTIASIQWPGGSRQFVFLPHAREAQIDISQGGASRGVGSFFLLGVEHILIGWDHLLFLLCLLLLGSRFWGLIKIVTAFTIAHSITLAAAALDLVTLPSRLVESAIALSIAYVAAENVFLRDRAASKRWLVAFIFGLVHGFGFSSVLKEIGLPREGLLWSLLGFNLGVEAGQAIVVAIAMPLLLQVRKMTWEPRAVATVSAVVLAVGLGLFVERLLV